MSTTLDGADPTVSAPADTAADTAVDPREVRAREARARRAVLAPIAGKLMLANVIVGLSAVFAVVPFILIVEVARRLLAGDTERVWPLLVSAVLTLGLRSLLYSAALFWTHLVDAENQVTIRRVIADKLRRVPLGWFGARRSAEVKKLLQDDVEAVHYVVAHAQVEFVAAITVPALTLGYLLWVDWRLALLLLLPLLGYVLALAAMMGRDHRDRMAVYEQHERRTEAATIEFVDGIQVVRAFGQSGRAHRRFQDAVDEFARYFTNWATPMTRIEAAAGVLLNPVCLLSVVLVGGLWLSERGSMERVDLLPFLLLGLGLGSTVLTVGHAMQSRRRAATALVRLHELTLTAELRHLTADESAPVDDAPGTVRFDSVHFAYREGSPVLRGVDLALRPGTVTALVGPSGSGKSTLASLVPRFADPLSGRVLVGGDDVRSLEPAELYRQVGFVFQDVRLLRASIRDNLQLADPSATHERLEWAARGASIHDRIEALPRGYDSVIGDDAHLSGGEAQRISIARALLADAPVLVLDEATAFADPESEAAIQDALATLVRGRTVLVIAHRLHTITEVDQIVVLDAGQVVERGTHLELVGAGGAYSQLWEANQAALADLADGPSERPTR